MKREGGTVCCGSGLPCALMVGFPLFFFWTRLVWPGTTRLPQTETARLERQRERPVVGKAVLLLVPSEKVRTYSEVGD